MANRATPQWSNELLSAQQVPPVGSVAADLERELRTPTPHEQTLAALAEKNKDVKPQRYDITSKNPKALRVIYSHDGACISIPPGETKRGVLLHPGSALYLGRNGSDLELVPAA